MHQPVEPNEDTILFQAAEVAWMFDIELPLDLVGAWLQLRFGLPQDDHE